MLLSWCIPAPGWPIPGERGPCRALPKPSIAERMCASFQIIVQLQPEISTVLFEGSLGICGRGDGRIFVVKQVAHAGGDFQIWQQPAGGECQIGRASCRERV